MTEVEVKQLLAAMPDPRTRAKNQHQLTQDTRRAYETAGEDLTQQKTLQRQETVFTLPYPPSTNRRERWLSEPYRAYLAEAGMIARLTCSAPLCGRVAVSMTLHPRKPKRDVGARVRCLDLDNAAKVALDSMNGIAYIDDADIDDLRIMRGEPVAGGALVVTVKNLEGGE